MPLHLRNEVQQLVGEAAPHVSVALVGLELEGLEAGADLVALRPVQAVQPLVQKHPAWHATKGGYAGTPLYCTVQYCIPYTSSPEPGGAGGLGDSWGLHVLYTFVYSTVHSPDMSGPPAGVLMDREAEGTERKEEESTGSCV